MTALVGGVTLPVPAGAALSEIADPTLLVLLDYLAYSLKVNLDAKLAVLTPTSADACPAANRFPWDPQSTWTRQAMPSLFAWETRAEARPQTLVYDVIEREISVLYVFAELVKPTGMRARHGLSPTVGRIFAQAAERNRHPTYAYPGTALGSPIHIAAGWLSWQFVRGEQVFLATVPGGSEREGGSGSETAVQRGFVGYRATFRILERIYEDQQSEYTGDTLLTLNASDGETAQTTEFMQRWLTSPDGSEQPDG